MARAMENAEKQAGDIEGRKEVNRVWKKAGRQQDKTGIHKVKCYRCGREGHKSMDKNCKAWGQTCRKCKGKDHFERVCKSKPSGNDFRKEEKPKRVRQVEDGDRYAFTVRNSNDTSANITINVGGIPVQMIIDSGATCNIIDQNLWEHLKLENIRCESTKCKPNVYPYGSEEPLPVLGKFTANVTVGKTSLDNVEFIVIEGSGQALLGRATASDLGVLKLGQNVHTISKSVDIKQPQGIAEIFNKFPGCCEGIGKLKGFQLKIPIDDTVEPIAQPMRRVPYHLRDKLSKKLDELLELDIIEEVSGPSSWVSPVVVIPKGDDIRLCVDMRQANSGVRRERYPVPTVDEVLQDLNQSKYFSKLDLNSAYHQIELEPESRDITTFSTHRGLFRYKRLMFGVSCAPEMYQKILQQVLQECEGAHNILDDIIIHGEAEEEHDIRFEKVVQVLNERGLTFNRDKCQYKMAHLEFMGHVLPEHGVGPTEAKVRAVAEAREPRNAGEVRSFLGLVNFTARFIPDLTTVSAPLRKLTKAKEPFVWGYRSTELI